MGEVDHKEEEKNGNYKKVTTAEKGTRVLTMRDDGREGLVFNERADGGASETAARRRRRRGASERERER